MFLVNTFLVACVLAVSSCASPSVAAARRGRRQTRPCSSFVDGLVRDGAPGAIAVVRTPARDPPRPERARAEATRGADGGDRPLPGREHHEELRRDDRAPARRRGEAAPRRHRRAPAARAPSRRPRDHDPGAARSHERPRRLRGGRAVRPGRDRAPRSHLAAAEARRDRDLARPALPARKQLLLREHQLHRARTRRGGRDRTAARPPARASPLPPARARRDLVSRAAPA